MPTSDMIGQINEGLYRITSGSDVEPGQAESVDISEDGLVYTFHLRVDLTWSNGEPLTAHDFVYSYQRLVDPVSGSVAATTVKELFMITRNTLIQKAYSQLSPYRILIMRKSVNVSSTKLMITSLILIINY